MVHVPLALKLHAFGLQRLHDPNWTGMVLFDHLKQYMRGRGEPPDMLYRTLRNGVLWHLGGWFYDDLLAPIRLETEIEAKTLQGEYLAWHVEEVAAFVATLDAHEPTSARKARNFVQEVSELYDKDEKAYYDALEDPERIEQILEVYRSMIDRSATSIDSSRTIYANDYADRVFHDRQLCGFISQLVLAIGIDGSPPDGETPSQWVKRRTWPEWTKRVLQSRERGKCAICCNDLSLELEDDPQIDHIVPLSRGGTNDLANLQMLCAPCNRKKSDKDVEVRSSIPPYLSRHLGK